MKLSLGEGGVKGFLAQHCEKIVAGIVAIVAIIFIWDGFTEKGLEKGDPSDLNKKAEDAISHVNTVQPATVERIVGQYSFDPSRYIENVKAGQREASSSNYPLAVPLVQPTRPPHTKRPDPQLFPPEGLMAFVVTGPMEYGEKDPLLGLDDAEMPEVEQKVERRRPTRTKRTPPGGMMGMGMGMEGMGEDMMDGRDEEDTSAGYGGGMGMAGMGMGDGATGGGKIWTLPEVYLGTYKPNVNPGMGNMGGMPGMENGQGTTGKTKGFRGVSFVMLSALIPYSKQFEEFENSLMNATGYIPERDRPNYQYIEVERAEITEANKDLPADQLTWKNLSARRRFLESKRQEWFNKVRDPTQPEYLDEFLTYPFPPVALRDFSDLLVRDELPIKKKQTGTQTTKRDEPEISIDQDPTAAPPEGDEDGVRRRRSGGMGMGGGMDMGMGGNMEMGMGGMDGGYGGTMEGGYGSGMGGMTAQQVVEHKLIRYFDFVNPGQRFRYRIRLVLEDPNFPYEEKMTPAIRTLDEDATKRVVELMKTGGNKRPWRRMTEWTKATDIVHVAPRNQMLGGSVKGPEPKTVTTPSGKVSFPNTDPTGKFLPVTWDSKYAADIPAEIDVTRGSVVNTTTNVAIPHPLTNVIKEVKDYQVATNSVVVDIRGGVPMEPSSGDDPLLSPGEFALIDPSGRLIVRNELDDRDDYRRFTYYDDKRMAAPIETQGGEMEGSDGFPGMDMGMEGLGYGEN